ncbi:efflux RND transporter periplasmic adaptor subunit [Sphingomonas montanisoli]|uniref:Efflux RND transporter periplasmic adaptor subunit n=1 Tax=Sphingomonas montanisoli TaxID=2606412 RepID=A0A5D9C7B0_9SPHN|nr:efflux RND transporter periplasmic adaptor subunit [Sphingomonas montanisoli]TZG27137.1 efflux RND transporter periplasmic adaptor subunit [Sphingomonas montanisoli]
MRTIALIPPLLLLAACGSPAGKSAAPPAKTELTAHESELLKIRLTPEADKRLGIVTTRVGAGAAGAVRQAPGEIVAPAANSAGVPAGAAANFQQLSIQQATADGEVRRTVAQAKLARIALDRAEALVRQEAGSVRARDEAAAALAAADAAASAAHAQRQLLGPSIASLDDQRRLWVRVSLFSSDLSVIGRRAPVTVHALGDAQSSRAATPVDAAPSANAVAGTVDLYYSVPNADRRFRIGQRVAVDLPVGRERRGATIPTAALVRDIYGGEWVYRRTKPAEYLRQRVDVVAEKNGTAFIGRGLDIDAEVVTTGAAELFGIEFGAAH